MEERRLEMLNMVQEGKLPTSARYKINNARTDSDLDKILAKYAPTQGSEGQIALQEYQKACESMKFWQNAIAELGEGTGDMFADLSNLDDPADIETLRASYEAHIAEAKSRMDVVYNEAKEYARFLGVEVYRRLGFGW